MYQATEGWKEFKNIVEMEKNAVREVSRSAETDDVTYSITGARVESPHKGVYIRNGKKEIK